MGIIIFLVGTILGSFYLVIGSRLPLKENIFTGRSRCDSCYTQLKWYEMIPIFSYLWQRGKCNYCHKKINILHLIIEIVTGVLFLIGYLYYGLNISLGIYLVSISLALIIFISDFKYMVILDSPLIISSILLIALKYFEIGFKGMGISIIYGLSAVALMFLIKVLGDKIYKRESLGGGDIKLAFVMGLILGYPYIGFRLYLISLIFASFLALPYALANLFLKKKNELPYGPFLISSAVIMFIFLDKFKNLLIFFFLS